MTYQTFIAKTFKDSTLAIIDTANGIIEEMAAAGYKLTVRQLYYQFVARGLLANKQENYKRLASIIDDARKAGVMDWDAIEDRTRTVRGYGHGYPIYLNPSEFITDNARNYYHEDLWENQTCYAEVGVEKDALLGVVERPANALRVPHYATRGYASSSFLYEAGQRFAEKLAQGKTCYLFYLGDHDPSGIDMTRNNEELLNMFADTDGVGDGRIIVERLALNMDQVRRYNPPPNPAKESDSRSAGYISEYGTKSWELDALDPAVIDSLIRTAVESIMDMDQFETDRDAEKANRSKLIRVAKQWDEVAEQFAPDDI